MISKPMKHIAIIGSSGGGGAGELMGPSLVETIMRYALRVRGESHARVTHAVFICCNRGLDFSSDDSPCRLYVLSSPDSSTNSIAANDELKPSLSNLKLTHEGSLSSINPSAVLADQHLATLISSGQIDALISISSDPQNINLASTQSAIDAGIPIVGTGGTSMSCIASAGGLIVGASGGSVSSTQVSRALCYLVSLCSHWKLIFDYDDNEPDKNIISRLHCIAGAALPLLLCSSITSSIINAILLIFPNHNTSYLHIHTVLTTLKYNLRSSFVNTAIGMLANNESSHLSELSYLTGAAAASLCSHNRLACLIAGYISGITLPHLLIRSAKLSLLPTAATVVSVGGAALLGGISSLFIIELASPFISAISISILDQYNLLSPILKICIGAILGYAASWGSEQGYYHTVMLPLIACEMHNGEFGIFGCIDWLCLCLPSAAVCSAVYSYIHIFSKDNNILYESSQKREGHIRLTSRGIWGSLIMGDFVEACYPYSLNRPLVLASIRLSCALSGAIVIAQNLKSSAYLPLPVSIFQAVFYSENKSTINTIYWVTTAIGICFSIPFIATVISLITERTKYNKMK